MPRKKPESTCPFSGKPVDVLQVSPVSSAVMVVSPHGWKSRIFPNPGLAKAWMSSFSTDSSIEEAKDPRGFKYFRAVGKGWTGPLFPFRGTAERWAGFRDGTPPGELGTLSSPSSPVSEPDAVSDGDAEDFVTELDKKLGNTRKK